jgi:hypothetical protein
MDFMDPKRFAQNQPGFPSGPDGPPVPSGAAKAAAPGDDPRFPGPAGPFPFRPNVQRPSPDRGRNLADFAPPPVPHTLKRSEVAELVRMYRMHNCISRRTLGAMAGVSDNTVRNVELSRHCLPSTLDSLLWAIGFRNPVGSDGFGPAASLGIPPHRHRKPSVPVSYGVQCGPPAPFPQLPDQPKPPNA